MTSEDRRRIYDRNVTTADESPRNVTITCGKMKIALQVKIETWRDRIAILK